MSKESIRIFHSIESHVKSNKMKVAIIAVFYYEDRIDKYIPYLSNLDNSIDIYCFSSKQVILDKISCLDEADRFKCIIKENRGRDISALLVSAKSVIKKYDVFCFLHDKKENADYLKEDAVFWNRNLWENMVKSKDYVNRIIDCFSENEELGLMVPPEPYGDYYSHWYGDTWFDDYYLTVDLAKKLGLNIEINRDDSCQTLGSVFWARTDALSKLLKFPWEYDDFPEEPLPIDGTINHAIERIIGYVVKDAGYIVSTVMTDDYAGELLELAQRDMRYMFKKISKKEHVFNMYQVRCIEEWKANIIVYAMRFQKIYIYGAGNYGKSIRQIMEDNLIGLSGFIVSTGRKNFSAVDGIPVVEIDEIDLSERIGIVVGVSYEYRKDIHEILEGRGYYNYLDGF